jgi:hypothetical protein
LGWGGWEGRVSSNFSYIFFSCENFEVILPSLPSLYIFIFTHFL